MFFFICRHCKVNWKQGILYGRHVVLFFKEETTVRKSSPFSDLYKKYSKLDIEIQYCSYHFKNSNLRHFDVIFSRKLGSTAMSLYKTCTVGSLSSLVDDVQPSSTKVRGIVKDLELLVYRNLPLISCAL
jgi:hypothetical protein